ncbi:MAG: hypothetical protein AAFX09_08495 [Pseudomonadota bacterium]
MHPIKTLLAALAATLSFQGSAQADVCSDPALAEVRYQSLRVQLQTGAEPADLVAFMAQVRAIAILSWHHKGRDAVARDGFVVNAIAACIGRGRCGLSRDGALSQSLYDDLNAGFPNNVFGRMMYERPPTTAMRFARETFECTAQPVAAATTGDRSSSLTPAEQQMIETVIAYQEERFEDAYRTAAPLCDGGMEAACHLAGDIKKREGTPEALSLARAHFAAACAQDMALACYEQGLLLFMSRGGPEDLVGARAAFRLGCEGDHVAACGGYAELLYSGRGGPLDYVEAARVGTIACDGEDPVGCFFLGLIAEREGRRADMLAFQERGCRLGFQQSCAIAEYVYGASAQAEGSHIEAYLHFVSGCERDGGAYSALLCMGAAQAASRPDVDISEDVIEGHLQRACDLGQADACDMLEQNSWRP